MYAYIIYMDIYTFGLDGTLDELSLGGALRRVASTTLCAAAAAAHSLYKCISTYMYIYIHMYMVYIVFIYLSISLFLSLSLSIYIYT